MEQIAVSFTDGGVPKTGLTPKITILGRDGTIFVDKDTCKELSNGWYIYNFAKYSPTKVYLYVFDGGEELESDYDRYKFGGNEFDAYSNKYSWGRTAAPYFTSINGRFDGIDKSIRDAVNSRKEYDDKEIRKGIADIKKEIKGKGGYDVYKKLDSLDKILNEVKQSVVDTSATNDGNSSKNFSGINGKLDLMADYVARIKSDIDNQLSTLDDNVAQRITESNMNLNQGLSSRVTIQQLLQQVARLENKLNDVVDAVISKRLPRELVDNFDVSINRKSGISDEQLMNLIGGGSLNEGLNEGISEGMEVGMSEGLGEPRPEGMSAPVDMQGIAEPEMPLNY